MAERAVTGRARHEHRLPTGPQPRGEPLPRPRPVGFRLVSVTVADPARIRASRAVRQAHPPLLDIHARLTIQGVRRRLRRVHAVVEHPRDLVDQLPARILDRTCHPMPEPTGAERHERADGQPRCRTVDETTRQPPGRMPDKGDGKERRENQPRGGQSNLFIPVHTRLHASHAGQHRANRTAAVADAGTSMAAVARAMGNAPTIAATRAVPPRTAMTMTLI